jgi:ATP-binding cassette subfamily B protein
MKPLKIFRNLLYLLKPYWKHAKLYLLGKIALPLLFSPALALIDVNIIRLVIDSISAGAELSETLRKTALFVSARCGIQVARWSFLLLYDRWKALEISVKINRGIYEHALATDYKYFDNPDFYNNFTFAASELTGKSSTALELLSRVISPISIAVAMMAYLAELGLWITFISVAGSAVCLFAQALMQKLGIRRRTEQLPIDRKLDYIHRVAYQKQYAADLKSSRLARTILALFDKSGDELVGVAKKFIKPHWGTNMLQFIAYPAMELAELSFLIISVYTRGLGTGAIAGLFASAQNLNNQLTKFVALSGELMELSLYADKIRDFFELRSDIEPPSGGEKPPGGAFGIELRDVSFNYPNSNFGLKNLNISIAPGEKVAIVGENGAGKTTLSKLLLRLYEVDGGEILYNGKTVRDYDVHALRRRIGAAFQQTQLYALTVRENLCVYGEVSDEKLRGLLRSAGLELDLDAEVTREFDEKGLHLSGGEAQKLALVRLLAGEFGLLLLDEPSSALDPLSEYNMTRLMFDGSRTTTILVAHRLSPGRNADRIYLISNGEVAEQGTHDELMSLGGRYAEMFAKQAENYAR